MKTRIFACDFETTVYDGQTETEVWSSACVELETENVIVLHSIDETLEYFISLKSNLLCYYHNLKFDGAFWLDYLMRKGFTVALDNATGEMKDKKELSNGEFIVNISGMGQWYSMVIKAKTYTIELRDSLKLLPFTLKEIGKAFNTKHQKLEMDYVGYRYAGCYISDEEMEYIKNDVLVLKEALEIMFNEGHKRLTIGSCCMSEFKKIFQGAYGDSLSEYYPNLSEIEIDKTKFGSETVDEYIRKSYKGGWCYVAHGKENTVYQHGCTADVNSLYPSMMSSQSGNKYPFGKPVFWSGNFIPKYAQNNNSYFFVRIRGRFYLKENKLPFIQIKGDVRYKGNEMLLTSDVIKDGKPYRFYKIYNSEVIESIVELTLTETDYKLFMEHYVFIGEILDGCYFQAEVGVFDDYINKYKKIKMENKGAKRTLAKLFLNNLCGKLATSPINIIKVPELIDDKVELGLHKLDNKKPIYIPAGSAITSYARNFTIRTAQANYKHFIYADTDSIHCNCKPSELKNVPIHDTEFCHWKLESEWDSAIFARQKTYVEHITKHDGEEVEPYYDIKCAGMPKRCKDLFNASLTGVMIDGNQQEKEFMEVKRDLTDFSKGLLVPSKLIPKRIKGGIILVPTTFEMRG